MKYCFIELEALLIRSPYQYFHIIVHAYSQLMELYTKIEMIQGDSWMIERFPTYNTFYIKIGDAESFIVKQPLPFFVEYTGLVFMVYDTSDNGEVFHYVQPLIVLANDNEVPNVSFYCEEYNCVKTKRVTMICIPLTNVEVGFSGNPQLQL